MVQKSKKTEPKRRGRPRAYDPDDALERAIRAFWKTGYSGTSLDDLSAATGMNRPSLYAAFGDKRALYLKALDHYWALGRAAMKEALTYERPLREALMAVYRAALAVYLPEKGDPRGCFAIGTATTEASADLRIRAHFIAGLRDLDQAFERACDSLKSKANCRIMRIRPRWRCLRRRRCIRSRSARAAGLHEPSLRGWRRR